MKKGNSHNEEEPSPELVDENEELLERVERLEAENEKLRERSRLMWAGYQGAGGLAALIALGPALVKASRAWFEKVGAPGEMVPRLESADLFAAILRRFIAIGALGLMMAGIPAILLYRQNDLIATQNQYFQQQNEKIQRQLDDQANDTRIVRRAQLLNTIYELEDCEQTEVEGEDQEGCPVKAPARLRAEAVRALRQLDETSLDLSRSDLSATDLSFADLRGSLLGGVDFSRAALVKTRFDGCELPGANFHAASLFGANLTGAFLVTANFSLAQMGNAILFRANLSNADLSGASLFSGDCLVANLDSANLRGTDLHRGDLTGANLYGANLSGAELREATLGGAFLYRADLSKAKNLEQEQLTCTCGDSQTSIPESLERPVHWLEVPVDFTTSWQEGWWLGCPPAMRSIRDRFLYEDRLFPIPGPGLYGMKPVDIEGSCRIQPIEPRQR